MALIYIAGPYTTGDVNENVRNALIAAEQIVERGHTPVVPHLSHFWHLVFPHEWEYWMHLDSALLSRCDGVFRLYGDSSGADREVAQAEREGLPVFYSLDEISLASVLQGRLATVGSQP